MAQTARMLGLNVPQSLPAVPVHHAAIFALVNCGVA
jgi:hypothetical protein